VNVSKRSFAEQYGPWALVAGGSEGLGAAWSRALAARGLNLVICARRIELLDRFAGELRSSNRVEVRTIACDLASPDALDTVGAGCAGLAIGLLVYNAALSPIGPFFDQPVDKLKSTIDVNCAAELRLVHEFGGRMKQRGRGGIILMTSLSGMQGTSMVTTYAATKAFTLVLAEGLWRECRGTGVHVLACVGGPILTPGYISSKPAGAPKPPGEMMPEAVVRKTLAALGRKPVVIPGLVNRLGAFFLTRLMPRRAAVDIISMNTEAMYRPKQ
jgi:uncharacterized protein